MKLDIDFIIPNKISPPFGWIGHIPFIQWLIKNYKPKKYVELGTHKGNSYFAVCQAVQMYDTKTECYAVDTWIGEEHAGYYYDDVYKEVDEWNKNNYKEFSVLVKAFFDDALSSFRDKSIDLLHIDGLHTYEAVKHDFEAWLPKLADNSIVLFHDINVFHDDFGVYKLWDELKSKYLTFSFSHSYGLGVLFIGDNSDRLSDELQFLFNADNSNQKYLIREQFVNQFAIMNDAFMSAQANTWNALPYSYLFYSQNNQFDSDDCYKRKLVRSECDNSFELLFEFKSTEYVKKLRWDPIDGLGCKLSDIKIIVYGKSESPYSLNECQTNGIVDDGDFYFYTIDPIVEIFYNGIVNKVLIAGYIEYISSFDIEQHFNNTIRSKDEEISKQKHSIKKLWDSIKSERQRNEDKYNKDRLRIKTKKLIRALKNPIVAYRYKKNFELIRDSFFFDIDFYLLSNTDLFLSCFDPIDHYISYGWKEFRKPSEYFDTGYYITNYSDVAEIGIEPLFHYLVFGWKEGRNPHPLFDVNYYSKKYFFSNTKNEIEPYEHYITYGWKNGYNPNPFFDVSVYLKNANINEEPILHYKKIGCKNDISFTNNVLVQEHVNKLNKIKDGNGLDFLLLNRASYRHIDLHELTFNFRGKRLKRTVTIVVPIFVKDQKSLRVLQNLIDSLKTSYPCPNNLISFALIDDASSEKEVFEYYKKEVFFKRTDVLLKLKDNNEGFLPTVNFGIELSDKHADIVILNSDTEVFRGTFETLQSVAYSQKFIATVTPLSNKALIASITNWPYGDNSIFSIPNNFVAEVIRSVGLKTPMIDVPTGHGYCMYMKREVIDLVGLFREDLYGRGYGEENDWCQRAIKKGYSNIITTECYVFHNDNTSFTKSEKKKQGDKNIFTLNKEFPNYNGDVAAYLQRDELKEYRYLLQIELLKHYKIEKNLKTFLYLLHDSVESSFGGTQLHVNGLVEMLKNYAAVEIFILSPISYNNYEKMHLHYYNCLGHEYIIDLVFTNALEYLNYLESRVDVIHVQHFQQMPEGLINFIIQSDISKKLITLHDYSAFCYNLFLLDNNFDLCNYKEITNCMTCRKTEEQSQKYYCLLRSFDTIFVPSESMYKIVHSMRFVENEIKQKLFVLKHFLFFEKILPKIQLNNYNKNLKNKKIVFLGVAVKHKGIDLFLDIVDQLRMNGYKTEIWGERGAIKEVESYEFSGWQDLYMLHKNNPAYIIVMPSLCPETFSYSLFESVCLLNVPVVVGPYGNPAEIVNNNKIGISIDNLESNHLFNAIQEIDSNIGFYKNNIKLFIESELGIYSQKRFLKEYLDKINDIEYHYNDKRILDYNFYESKTNEISSIKKLNVLYFSSFSGLNDGPWRYRVHNVKKLLEMSGCHVKIAKEDDCSIYNEVENFDIIIFHRVSYNEYYNSLIEKAKNSNVFLVYDSDDLVFFKGVFNLLPFWSSLEESHKDEYKSLISKQFKTAYKCDVISCSTQMISKYANYIDKNNILIRNFIVSEEFKSIKRKKKNKNITIGIFSGSQTHDKDLEFLKPLLIKCANEKRVNIIVMGHFKNESHKDIPNVRFKEFTNYKNYLNTIAKCDLSIVPSSVINDFTASKSAVKFLEAAALKVPVIASPLPEYKRYIEHGKNGWIANNIGEWEELLLNLPSIQELRKAGENAYRRLNEDSVASTELAEKTNKLLQAVINNK